MGANAQTTVPTFTASQVLTADQQNQSARTGVPVFATTITRDAAFGGTGEKTLAEGQLAYVEGTGLQTYNGSSWVTWGTAPSTGGLVYITGAAFTTVTSVSFANSTFTSTYRNYRVIFDITASSAATSIMTARMRASGSDDSNASYSYGWAGYRPNGSGVSIVGSATTSFGFGFVRTGAIERTGLSLDVIDPQVAELTRINGALWGSDSSGGDAAGFGGGGVFNNTTAFDAMSFISGTGTITGVYRVYGYKDS